MKSSKKSIVLASATMLTATALPLIAVSCGSTVEKPRTITEDMFGFPARTGGMGGSGATLAGKYQDIFTNGVVPTGFGVQSSWDYSSGDKMPSEYKDRKSTGRPKAPAYDGRNAWYWRPDHSVDGNMAADDMRNATLSAAGLPNFVSEYDWHQADGDFAQATIRDIHPRTMGEKLKPTQSATAGYHNLTNFTQNNADNNIGIVPMGEGGDNIPNVGWEYNTTAQYWGGGQATEIKAPSGPVIDVSHQNGVPVMATMFLWPDGNGNTITHYLNTEYPAGSGEYPAMRGLVEIADFYGFDGWFIDWEAGAASPAALDALSRYAHSTDENLPNIALGSTLEEQKALRAKYNYKHRPQIISNYAGGYGHGDMDLAMQAAGNNNVSSMYHQMEAAGKDYLFSSGCVSHQEGIDISNRALGNMYQSGVNAARASMPQYASDNSKVDTSDYTATPSGTGATDWEKMTTQGRASENMFSVWSFSYSQNSENEESSTWYYSGRSGDPRHIDSKEKWSVSNDFQERTPIVGHENFTTNFNYGMGKTFHMWGYDDMNPYMALANERNGWKYHGLQDVLPTYKWIVDEYNASGTKTSDYMTLDPNGHVQRRINPSIDFKSNDAWFGGSVLKYSGILQNIGDSFVNKLYASNVKLETGDKFEIMVKNGSPEPQLGVWTSDTAVDPTSTFNEGTDSWGNRLGFGNPSDVINDVPKSLEYYNESVWKGVQRKENFISPASSTKMGDSGWTKLTYDLSSLAGKTMMDFGIKVTATEANQDMGALQIGQMSYKAAGTQVKPVVLSNAVTQHNWDLPSNDSSRVRLTWDAKYADGTDATVENYFTFLANDDGTPYNLIWVGAQPAAYLSQIPHGATHQNILVVGVDKDFNMVANQQIDVALKPTTGGN